MGKITDSINYIIDILPKKEKENKEIETLQKYKILTLQLTKIWNLIFQKIKVLKKGNMILNRRKT